MDAKLAAMKAETKERMAQMKEASDAETKKLKDVMGQATAGQCTVCTSFTLAICSASVNYSVLEPTSVYVR